MFQISKQSLSGKKVNVLLLNENSEILEFDTIEEANALCDILNANASGFLYQVKVVTGVNSYYFKNIAAEPINKVALISEYLEVSREYNLEAEVVYFALNAMKKDRSLSIEEAMEIGFMNGENDSTRIFMWSIRSKNVLH